MFLSSTSARLDPKSLLQVRPITAHWVIPADSRGVFGSKNNYKLCTIIAVDGSDRGSSCLLCMPKCIAHEQRERFIGRDGRYDSPLSKRVTRRMRNLLISRLLCTYHFPMLMRTHHLWLSRLESEHKNTRHKALTQHLWFLVRFARLYISHINYIYSRYTQVV